MRATTTTEADTTTTSAPTTSPISRPASESFIDCELLPTKFDVVEVILDDVPGPPVEIFDLANSAEVESFRIRASTPIPLMGELHEGVMHYVIYGDWESEWLVGPTFDTRILGPEGWVSAGELLIPPWWFAEPTVVYLMSMTALGEMEHVRWEIVEGRDAAVFLGGPTAFAAFEGDEEIDEPDSSVEIWMSPDCYPILVRLKAESVVVIDWELYDFDAEVDFEIPDDMLH